jgi:hypothetical protein
MKAILVGCGAALLLLAAGCGTSRGTGFSAEAHPVTVTTTVSAPSTTVPPASSTPPGPPHFATPEAAMVYLAAAWNRGDLTALNHVTNPAARAQLNAMHGEAVNLRLLSCTKRVQGDYDCEFAHDYPNGSGPAGAGRAEFLVGPASTPGWYMTVYESCG